MEKKHILVTGGARGIGKGIVKELLQKNYKVSFLYCGSKDRADLLVENQLKKGYELAAYQCNVKDYTDVSQTIKKITEERGDIYGLVNNAGITEDRSLFLMDKTRWDSVLDTNLNGAFHVIKSIITSFIKRKKGVIVNVSSVAGIKGMAGQTNYCTSKSGLIGFTKSLAVETAKYGIRVNAVAPGYINTDMTSAINEKVKKEIYHQIPMGREGTVEEVAPIVELLLSDAASYITGQVISIDGGITA
ncbi:3-oxoacyl-ACP reductase FabG [Streptococcus macacae]|uniref:KR domain protein n=1 Tax=Streptococcus macacae NCTC 11558 TaxID=764298 RepID=G5JUF4_9STRE|nr:3-oxoacyl-ACP reductase FabG [Streptococcus macacae]EHJ53152.1 KR domain protein [Streptococcus macacae NCTC 11558]SUN78596.1 3-oxoacyl-[acyl-carrier protein] reductase [Streptococcus macacae NCTC 11558]